MSTTFCKRPADKASAILSLYEARRSEKIRDEASADLSLAIESGLITPADLLDTPHSPRTFLLSRELIFADGVVRAVSLDGIEALLDRPVLMGGDPIHAAEFGNGVDQGLAVRTCREYRAAISANFFALSNYD